MAKLALKMLPNVLIPILVLGVSRIRIKSKISLLVSRLNDIFKIFLGKGAGKEGF